MHVREAVAGVVMDESLYRGGCSAVVHSVVQGRGHHDAEELAVRADKAVALADMLACSGCGRSRIEQESGGVHRVAYQKAWARTCRMRQVDAVLRGESIVN